MFVITISIRNVGGRDRHVKMLFSTVTLTLTLTLLIFRDEMHLGPFAHRLMATEIYHGIDILLNPKEVGSVRRHTRRGFAA
jgi:hypothetical protein